MGSCMDGYVWKYVWIWVCVHEEGWRENESLIATCKATLEPQTAGCGKPGQSPMLPEAPVLGVCVQGASGRTVWPPRSQHVSLIHAQGPALRCDASALPGFVVGL